MFRELTEAPGVPGQEEAVRKVMRKYLEPVSDEILADHLGSIAARKAGDPAGPRVMLAGHLDEIGFLVTYVTDDGFVKFQTLGGWWEQVMLAQRVRIITRKGPVTGVIGSKPPHILPADERKKMVEKKDMFIDVGASSRAEAESFGVRPGDMIVPVCPFEPMANPKYLLAKAWDNRFGCALAIEVLRRLQGVPHPNVVYAVGTVQEEIGLRGAQTTANLVEPDVGFALDVGIAGDTPGVKPEEARAKLGKGPVLLLYDASMAPHTGLRDLVMDTAEAEGIPYQTDVMPGGGTDAGRIHLFGRGAPSLVMGVPTRYVHSHASVLHRDDFDAAARLLVAVIRKLDRATVDRLRA